MHVVILGAGLLGVSSAWYIRQNGHRVTVVERRDGPALETSFSNGGQLSVGHVEPWASLETLPQVRRWIGQEDAPLLFRLRADWDQWRWAWAFLRECAPARSEDNFRQLLALGRYSQQVQASLDAALDLQYLQRPGGILNLYHSSEAWQRGQRAAQRLSDLGYPRQVLEIEAALQLEPTLRRAQDRWVGATLTPGDGSGDAHRWTEELAHHTIRAGVEYRFGHRALGLEQRGPRVTGVTIQGSDAPFTVDADAVVVALGSYSRPFLRSFGSAPLIYPVKGYAFTSPILEPALAPRRSITDDAHKMVFTVLGDVLRVAGTAEFNGFDTGLNPTRGAALVARAQALFPGLADYGAALQWSGLRPATPSNRPLIGPWHWPNLWLNTGHGTLGWTLGCGSAQALATLMEGQTPALDFEFLRLS